MCRNFIKWLLFYFLIFSIWHLSATEKLTPQFQKLSNEFGGILGLSAKNLKTGKIIACNSSRKFPTASVIKLPILVEFFFQVAAGKIKPETEVMLTDSLKKGGSGVLQFYSGSSKIKLIDAATLMIIVSDNTATNLVLDALGTTHPERLQAVNERMVSLGLQNTRLLNKLMNWKTKTDSPESIRYGVGVTTPDDMLLLLEKMYHGELVSPEYSRQMLDILKRQQYDSMIPRYLPSTQYKIQVAHKTGSVTAVRNDVGIIFSEVGDFAVSIFCDDIQDYRFSIDNLAEIAGAKATRLLWNYFTGQSGELQPNSTELDWNAFPGGQWAKLRLEKAPFPHPAREKGMITADSVFYDPEEHYAEGSAIVVMPAGWFETEKGINLIVHFHGHRNEVLNVLEQFYLPQQLIKSGKNALLILAQGPRHAPDSFGGKMEDQNGFKNFVTEILNRLQADKKINSIQINQIIISAHSGGYRPAAFVLDVGGLTDKISEVYLFDAFYAQHDKFLNWIVQKRGKMISIYTEHLADEHQDFFKALKAKKIKFAQDLNSKNRLIFYPTDVCHNCVMEGNFERYLKLSGLENIQGRQD